MGIHRCTLSIIDSCSLFVSRNSSLLLRLPIEEVESEKEIFVIIPYGMPKVPVFNELVRK